MQRRTKTDRAAQAAETTAAIGHNSGDVDDVTETAQTVAAGQLRALIERIERLTEERQTVSDDIKEVYAEAKGTGFDVTALRTLIRLRRMDQAERAEREAILDLYKSAIGMA